MTAEASDATKNSIGWGMPSSDRKLATAIGAAWGRHRRGRQSARQAGQQRARQLELFSMDGLCPKMGQAHFGHRTELDVDKVDLELAVGLDTDKDGANLVEPRRSHRGSAST